MDNARGKAHPIIGNKCLTAYAAPAISRHTPLLCQTGCQVLQAHEDDGNQIEARVRVSSPWADLILLQPIEQPLQNIGSSQLVDIVGALGSAHIGLDHGTGHSSG